MHQRGFAEADCDIMGISTVTIRFFREHFLLLPIL